MNILIIGGTGLISTAITRQLLQRGDAVTHLNRGKRDAGPAGVRTIHCDRQDEPAFEQAVRTAGPFDAVIDMICFNAAQARSLLRAAAGNCGQIVFCSTVDVYARPASRYPITEAEGYGAASQYGCDKEAAERVLLEADGQDGTRVTVLRPASTYAEGVGLLHPLGWSTSFLDRLLKRKPVIVHGDGTSLWVSCHAEDVARGFLGALGNEAAYGRAYHLTGEEWITWDRHVQVIAEAIGAPKPDIVHIPSEILHMSGKGDIVWTNFMNNNIFDNAAARRDLGFRYTIPYREGARRVYESLVELGKIEPWDADPAYDELIARWRSTLCGLRIEFGR